MANLGNVSRYRNYSRFYTSFELNIIRARLPAYSEHCRGLFSWETPSISRTTTITGGSPYELAMLTNASSIGVPAAFDGSGTLVLYDLDLGVYRLSEIYNTYKSWSVVVGSGGNTITVLSNGTAGGGGTGSYGFVSF